MSLTESHIYTHILPCFQSWQRLHRFLIFHNLVLTFKYRMVDRRRAKKILPSEEKQKQCIILPSQFTNSSTSWYHLLFLTKIFMFQILPLTF